MKQAFKSYLLVACLAALCLAAPAGLAACYDRVTLGHVETAFVEPVTLGVSSKNLKATGGITLADACKQTAILNAEEWAKFTDPYPTDKGLYVACHDLAMRKRKENPFRVA